MPRRATTRRHWLTTMALAVLAALTALGGCEDPSEPSTPTPPAPTVDPEPPVSTLCGPVSGELQEVATVPENTGFLALDGSFVYGVTFDIAPGKKPVWRLPRGGGEPQPLGPMSGEVSLVGWFAYQPGELWYRVRDRVFSLIAGSADLTLEQSLTVPQSTLQQAIGPGAMVWLGGKDGVALFAQRRQVDGFDPVTTLTQLPEKPEVMLVTGNYVYLGLSSSVQRVGLDDGVIEPVAEGRARGMVTDGVWIYWMDPKRGLMRVPRAGGPAELLTQSPYDFDLIAPPTGGCLYVLADGRLGRMPREGGTVSILSQVDGLNPYTLVAAGDDRALYLYELSSNALLMLPLR